MKSKCKFMRLAGGLIVLVCLGIQAGHFSEAASEKELSEGYSAKIYPMLVHYCGKCHSGEKTEGDIDLGSLKTFAAVKKSTKVWQKTLEMLETSQMPPKEEKQLSPEEAKGLKGWLGVFLKSEALAHAGDPGRVVLRRLSNSEYTNSIRDITGINSLSPANEFPVDGAAGEGFTNVGDGLVMSPTLLGKYLDAGKKTAGHAVLLPDGIRFSRFNSRQDWTNEILGQIREMYRIYAVPGSSSSLKLQGVPIERKDAGIIPLDKYLEVLLQEKNGKKLPLPPDISGKYLGLLRGALNNSFPSPLLDPIRDQWKNAKPGDGPRLALEIIRWQQALSKFNTVGHIGKIGGPTSWVEPVNPIQTRFESRVKVPVSQDGNEVALYLVAHDAGDGSDQDYVVWEQPRFVAPGKPEVPLKNVRQLAALLEEKRKVQLAKTSLYLDVISEAIGNKGEVNLPVLVGKHGLDLEVAMAWLDYLGYSRSGPVKIQNHFPVKAGDVGKYPFVHGWNSRTADGLPSVIANASAQHVRIPGNLKPNGVVVHPSPALNAVIGWQSPIAGKVKIETRIAHAHPECGNGVAWSVVFQRGVTRRILASGTAQGSKIPEIAPIQDFDVREGDVLSVVVGPRDGNHSCDLTSVDFVIQAQGKIWNLARDVSPDLLQGNPHADNYGNKMVWHFYSEAVSGQMEQAKVIPKGSILDLWLAAGNKAERNRLAGDLQKLILGVAPADKKNADALLYQQITSLSGPLFGHLFKQAVGAAGNNVPSIWGVDPARFGIHPDGKGKVKADDLCVEAPAVVEIRLPADLLDGYELVAGGVIHEDSRNSGSVQLQVLASKPEIVRGMIAGGILVKDANGQWTGNNLQAVPTIPVIVGEGGSAKVRLQAAFDEFRSVFPVALCYSKIVPVDEVVTLTLYYREDDQLARLMLNDSQIARLDLLWNELHFVSQDAFALVDALEQIIQFATQDANPKVFEPLLGPFKERAAQFHKRMIEAEPRQLQAVLKLASQFWRRPVTAQEGTELTSLYHQLRKQGLSNEESIRLVLARVLVSPAFLYKLEKQSPAKEPNQISDWELAGRLSYFLWSSTPDETLYQLASEGKLKQKDVLVGQMQRMLKDDRVRRLATEFGCQWLHVRGFDQMNEKSEQHFPLFSSLKSDMYEESILFFTDLFQHDRSMLDVFEADFTYLNEPLAKHYGIPGVQGPQWRRVEGVRKYGRGGIFGLATTLATQSGASRTSPILRGNWVSEVLLGEKLPRPPKGVPQLPDDETKTDGLTVRQLIEKHSSNEKCAVCHKRIDAYGFSLEGYDAIGKRRDRDLANRPIDVRAKTADGVEFEGIDGLRNYLLEKRKDAITRQFCRKLLGYSLGRGVQLSDEPLLNEMQSALERNNYRLGVAFEKIVTSRQFLEIRGAGFSEDN